MSARIINLAAMRELRARPETEVDMLQETTAVTNERFHFWCGASGQRYVHTIYSLLECPAIPASNYILVKREASGRRSVLSIGRLTHDIPSLNLAEIRQRGAELGANEVHVHLLAATAKQSKLVEFDLRTGQVRVAPGASRALH
jgi:hypothetical protein